MRRKMEETERRELFHRSTARNPKSETPCGTTRCVRRRCVGDVDTNDVRRPCAFFPFLSHSLLPQGDIAKELAENYDAEAQCFASAQRSGQMVDDIMDQGARTTAGFRETDNENRKKEENRNASCKTRREQLESCGGHVNGARAGALRRRATDPFLQPPFPGFPSRRGLGVGPAIPRIRNRKRTQRTERTRAAPSAKSRIGAVCIELLSLVFYRRGEDSESDARAAGNNEVGAQKNPRRAQPNGAPSCLSDDVPSLCVSPPCACLPCR